jgi:hypothetical protein
MVISRSSSRIRGLHSADAKLIPDTRQTIARSLELLRAAWSDTFLGRKTVIRRFCS